MASKEDPKFTDEEAVDTAVSTEEAKSRKERLTGSTHFGDVDFYDEKETEIEDATWGEVFNACCVHSGKDWGLVFVNIVLLLFLLYFFLLGLELLGSSAKVIGGCTAGSLFGDDTNPIGALMIGILATVLLQSSSTTTSIIIGLVGGGLAVRQAIYMIMGANIGTSVTNTIVAMGQMGDGDQLERAFGGATVHDMFNFLTVIILLPLEAISGYLFFLTKAMLPETVKDGDKWTGPLKRIVSPLGNLIIKANKKVTKDIASGKVENCDAFYPTFCVNGTISKATCTQVGLIECDKATGKCPAFFQNGATQNDDEVSGGVCLFLALVLLIVCLLGLVTLLQKMLLGTSTRIIYKATNINGYLAMLIGAGVTLLVQSSSITTSALTPLVGLGVLHVDQMYPLTLGANIGTTITGLLAALVSDNVGSLQVALCHLFFNITGILIFYPIPFMRRIPINAALSLGKATRYWRFFPVIYIVVIFFVVPLALLGLSELFERETKGFTVLGSFIVIAIILGICYGVFWYKKLDGHAKTVACLNGREKKRLTMKHLPDDIQYLKDEIKRLKGHTGLPDEEEEETEEADLKADVEA